MMSKFKTTLGLNKGFTLIELMVALVIFSIVVVVALAALVKILDSNRKAQTIQDAVVNTSFAMESMTREIRTGTKLYCRLVLPNADLFTVAPAFTIQDIDAVCDAGDTSDALGSHGIGLAFLSSRTAPGCNLVTGYEIVPVWSGGTFTGKYSLKKGLQTACGGTISWSPVIDPNLVSITSYFVQANLHNFPLAFIKIDASAGVQGRVTTNFTLQTAASPRLP